MRGQQQSVEGWGSGADDGGSDAGRSGVILIRAWLQDGRVVARVRWSHADADEQRMEVVVGSDEVERVVRQWLARVAPDGEVR